MRQAYKVWSWIAVGVFVLVAATDLGGAPPPTPSATSASAGSPTSASRPAPASAGPSVPSASATTPGPTTTSSAPVGETVTVAEVIDGDTLEIVGGRRVRLLGIDACEMTTRGGREAKDLLEGFVGSDQVRLIADGARDRDGSGRLLRRVETTPGSTDLGELMVIYPTVGIYQGRNDASSAYLAELRAADHGERDCSGTPPVSDTGGGDVDLDLDLGDGDDGLPDGTLTGGYCARKWWC